jgi:predicted 3-demethylubiquinone-9 3-methyltransferase (glyoxalase superfamily)
MDEAIDFYVGLFPDSERGADIRNGDTVIGADWTMFGQSFRAINEAGQPFAFNEALSLSVDCADQAEVDRYWDALTADGGEEGPCGWCKDRFGLWWQVVPQQLYALVSDADRTKANAALQAMMQMKKLVVADLQAAFDAT